ncbi:carbohydrate ABC transporter permease [Haladaptatus sp. CMSO5]|uniref:carbohydrate ABC transporter permease n=1 Tax=Haladaptatus sp. CMSO5 TaxID=3120514 RepID=UPI002FCE4D85
MKLNSVNLSAGVEKWLQQHVPKRIRDRSDRILLYLLASIAVVYSLFPLLWMGITSLQPEQLLFSWPPQISPELWTLTHYADLIETNSEFFLYYRNSVITSTFATVMTITLGTLGAYSISRFEYMGREFIDSSILLIYMFPAIVLVIPLSVLMNDMGLDNSWFGLSLVYLTFSLPFSIWVLREFFNGIPYSLEEAAMIDGASRMQAFYHVVLPNALPGIIATSIFTWSLAWNDYLWASVIMTSSQMQTLPVGLSQMLTSANPPWGQFMAATTLVTLPVLILYIFVQDHLVKGFGAGGVKG